MRAVESRHPPGLIIMLTGELARYADTMFDLDGVNAPLESGRFWFKSVLISDGLNRGFETLFSRPEMEWAWLMGDDHRFHPDTLLRLLDRDVDCIIPMCVHRMPPFPSNVRSSAGGKMVGDFPTTGTYRLGPGEVCGDAGMLIRKRVLEAIPRPWFDTRRSGTFSSDDQAFSQRIKDAGFDVHVDCDVRIGHIQPMAITPTVIDGEWKIRLDATDMMVCALNPAAGTRL